MQIGTLYLGRVRIGPTNTSTDPHTPNGIPSTDNRNLQETADANMSEYYDEMD